MKPSTHIRTILTLAFALAGAGVLNAKEPFFDGLGTYKRKVTTNSREAQRYFNQGLAFYHGFNHGEAIRSFQEAARLDPKCAMAHWGIALACGPHINLPLVSAARGGAGLEGNKARAGEREGRVAGGARFDRGAQSSLCQSAAGRSRVARSGLCGCDAQSLADLS